MLAWANEPNEKLGMPKDIEGLWGWRCSVIDENSVDPCSRPLGAGSHPAAQGLLLMCPDVAFDHVIKEALYTDCAAPDNLQPGPAFRMVFPNEKGV